MNQAFSKIWILIILIVFIAGGILAWQYLIVPEDGAKVSEEKALEEVELNYKNMLGQMFPEKEFSEVKENYFKDKENRTYYVEDLLEGSFIDPDEKNILLVIRRPMDELVHLEGFYRAFLAVFDIEGTEILTETMILGGDEGKITLYNCRKGTFVFYTGSTTVTGWTQGWTSLYQVKDKKFEEIWPENKKVWNQRIVEPKEDRIVVYERERIGQDFVCPTQCLRTNIVRPDGAIPSYSFVYSHDLYWNSHTCSFELTDETADWNVYQNEEYGFELKYPKEWRKPIETGQPYPAEGVLYSCLIEFYRSNDHKGLWITIYKKPGALDYAEVDEGLGLSLKGKEIPEVLPKPTKEVSIGVENYPAKIVYASPEDICFRETYFYILQKGNYNYVLTPMPNDGIGYVGYDGKIETEKHLPEFYQILSTFKFIK